jgi:hypothetical protein
MGSNKIIYNVVYKSKFFDKSADINLQLNLANQWDTRITVCFTSRISSHTTDITFERLVQVRQCLKDMFNRKAILEDNNKEKSNLLLQSTIGEINITGAFNKKHNIIISIFHDQIIEREFTQKFLDEFDDCVNEIKSIRDKATNELFL